MKRFVGQLSLAALIAVAACSYGKGAPYAEKGKLFPWKKAPSVVKGMSASEVRGLLGDPFEIVKVTDGVERWRYYVQERQDEHIYVLGIIPTRKTMHRGTAEALIEFRDGVVDHIESRFEGNRSG
jgi:outer membrane protein assembly factor BamE (lipoprotein component of BamABCDE complex)